MRIRYLVSSASLVGAAALLFSGGCIDLVSDCRNTSTCTAEPSGSSSGGVPIDPSCVPSTKGGALSAKCGVFVSSSQGVDTNDGSPEMPLKTIAKAIEKLGGKTITIYACAEEMPERLTIPAGTILYGGLDCKAGWAVSASVKTSIAPLADAMIASPVAVTLAGGAFTTHIERVSVTAPSATLEGGSSIAMLIDGATAEIIASELTAGDAMAGAIGETPTDSVGPTDPTDASIKGANGAGECLGDAATGNPGGSGAANALCATSIGGTGGVGKQTAGEAGTDGAPLPSPNPTNKGLGGAGDPDGSGCNPGGPGKLGAAGASGAGASASEMGALTPAGFVGAPGHDGTPGLPGQGGGGGGGEKGKLNCNGASGGGGGAGGCGGNGGRGGHAGGASIALASLAAAVTLTDVTLVSKSAGNGGDGGDGQAGATGGAGGFGGTGVTTLSACDGGKGGQGGFGGKGGGGRGGHSIGVAHTGAAPVLKSGSITTGAAGTGGLGADAAGTGADGMKADTLEFPPG